MRFEIELKLREIIYMSYEVQLLLLLQQGSVNNEVLCFNVCGGKAATTIIPRLCSHGLLFKMNSPL